MTSSVPGSRCRWLDRREIVVVLRVLLGGWFVYMGLEKALHPVDFLKVVHQYEVVRSVPWVNLVAVVLPGLEVFCGVLLVAGVAVRGAALVLLLLLSAFTALVVQRALALHAGGGLTFCAIRFDCGCGGGEVGICRKLTENAILMWVALYILRMHAVRRNDQDHEEK